MDYGNGLSRGTIVSRDVNGTPSIMTGTMKSDSPRKASEATVWRHANLDALTGIPNRRLFRERLEMESASGHDATGNRWQFCT